MSTEQTLDLMWADTPVPAARALHHFSATEVGHGEYVFFDNERLEYHTLNAPAFAVWQLCDGQRTSWEIAAALASSDMPLPVAAVELTVAELGEAGLFESTEISFNDRLDRRRVLRIAAAGVLGAAVVPTVSSITAPTSVSAATCNAVDDRDNGCPCTSNSICLSGCCCSLDSTCQNSPGSSGKCGPGNSGTCIP